jgi:uncharacterized repeat protein (TIGR03803 family)
VYEIPKTATGYASLLALVSFNGADGAGPGGSLIFDANGDLIGTTQFGGAYDHGTVFEIVKTLNGYADVPITLVNFDGDDGYGPGNLIADAAGNLFGTAEGGGSAGYGTVFEIVKTASGYASAPATLINFTGANGNDPSGLTADSAGDLFGTTVAGGPDNQGTVFELIDAESLTETWAANASGDWETATNWSLGHAPQVGDVVYIESETPIAVNFNSTTPLMGLGGLTLVGAELDITGGLNAYLETGGAVTLQNATIGGLHGALLISKDASAVINGLNISGAAIFGSNGTVTQSGGNITIGSSGQIRGAVFNNGFWTITDASGVTGTGLFDNNGVLTKTDVDSGASTISANFRNDGKILIASGSLTFSTEISGAGREVIDESAYLELDGQSTASQTVQFNGAYAELGLGDAGQFQSSIHNFGASFETVDLIGFDSNATKSFASVSGGLIVNISDGSQSASLHFVGSDNQAGFQLNTGSNGEVLTYSS